MELHTVLIMLSLLPLLEAQNPEHAINIGDPITNETLSWLEGQISPRSCGKYFRRLSHTWAWMNQKSYLSTGKRTGAVNRKRSILSWRRRPRKILRKARHELSSLVSLGCPHVHHTLPHPVHFDSVSVTIKVC
ncbi:alpha-1-acid glycoprotein 3 isoform 3 precursor [Mus musculus]|uniref:alpha-1-acid glycoprotein 3 isoform 3 precursor n=1 Tax=Mus musculus TaxID=10090 RepID=UPI0003D74B1E|nr:alpha-1-acid glycoprotein 3 isoform 3 precursor [Mus musculus]